MQYKFFVGDTERSLTEEEKTKMTDTFAAAFGYRRKVNDYEKGNTQPTRSNRYGDAYTGGNC